MQIHHIGYLVKRIDRAIAEFQHLGYMCENPSSGSDKKEYVTVDPIRKIKIAFLKNGTYRVELVEPLDSTSPIYGLLKKYKNSPYHICYSTADIALDIHALEAGGWMLFESPEIAPAINNCKVAFLMGPNSGMIELVEDLGEH